MPYSIDRQIQAVEERIKKEQKKLSALKKKKKEMILKQSAAQNKKKINELVNSGMSTEEIILHLKTKA